MIANLPGLIGDGSWAFTEQFIIVCGGVGIVFGLFTLDAGDVRPNLLWRKHAPHLGNEPRQFPGEFRMVGSSAGKIQ